MRSQAGRVQLKLLNLIPHGVPGLYFRKYLVNALEITIEVVIEQAAVYLGALTFIDIAQCLVHDAFTVAGGEGKYG